MAAVGRSFVPSMPFLKSRKNASSKHDSVSKGRSTAALRSNAASPEQMKTVKIATPSGTSDEVNVKSHSKYDRYLYHGASIDESSPSQNQSLDFALKSQEQVGHVNSENTTRYFECKVE